MTTAQERVAVRAVEAGAIDEVLWRWRRTKDLYLQDLWPEIEAILSGIAGVPVHAESALSAVGSAITERIRTEIFGGVGR